MKSKEKIRMCCGKGREQLQGTSPQTQNDTAGSRRVSGALFQYVGDTALTVFGPVTGKRYRFDWPGDRAWVDLRDRQSMAAVPHLREIR